MDVDDQRDYAEESANRAEMEREGWEEYCNCPSPSWVSGMMVVSCWDVQTTYEELKSKGAASQLVDERCDRPYHPDFSADPYA